MKEKTEQSEYMKLFNRVRRPQPFTIDYFWLDEEFYSLEWDHPHHERLLSENMVCDLVPVTEDCSPPGAEKWAEVNYGGELTQRLNEDNGYIGGTYKYLVRKHSGDETDFLGAIVFETHIWGLTHYEIVLNQIEVEERAEGNALGTYLNAAALLHCRSDLINIMNILCKRPVNIEILTVGLIDTKQGYELLKSFAEAVHYTRDRIGEVFLRKRGNKAKIFTPEWKDDGYSVLSKL